MNEDVTKNQFMYLMKKLVKALEEDNKKSEFLYDYCGGTHESWAFDIAVDALDALFSPKESWISWWVWENDCGKGGMEAGFNGKIKKIKTLGDLWGLINSG